MTLRSRAPADFHDPTAPMRLLVGDGRIALCGALTKICSHRNASVAVVVGLDAPLRLVANRSHVTTVAMIRPGFVHALDVQGRIAVFLLPVHAVSRADLAAVRDIACVSPWRDLGEAMSRGELDDFSIVDRAASRSSPDSIPLDDRLLRALEAVANCLDENRPVEEIAEVAGLSPSRLMALARAQLGASLREYRRWIRAFEVARRYAGGVSLTQAAFDAGFASSAHLAATSRAIFGVRPSQVLSPHSRDYIRVVESADPSRSSPAIEQTDRRLKEATR